MSKGDLDADLYGDLYGADDPEYSADAEPSASTDASTSRNISESAPAKEVPVKTTPVTTTNPAPTVTPAPKVAPATSNTNPIPTTSLTATSSAPPPRPPTGLSSIPVFTEEGQSSSSGLPRNPNTASYSSQVAQQFQQFNQSPSQGGAHQGGAAAAAAGDRSVRPSEMRDEGKMFVGGLNWDTTDDTLRDYFSSFGKVDACTIMRDAAGRSRGFAFLTFEDPAAVNAVMVREHHLDGKIIDPKRAIPRLEHHRTQKLFVGGLAPSVTTESMRQFFAQFGKVVDATVMVDRDSSRSKGFGFVTFEDAMGVEKLLQLGNLDLEGKMIEIKLAQPRGAGGNQPQGTYTSMSPYGPGRNGPPVNSTPQMQMPGMGNPTTPFDPQAMANLYQRMMQMAQNNGGTPSAGGWQGGMNPMAGGMGAMGMAGMGAGMGGMNPMMGGGMGRGMMGGPGMMNQGMMGMGRGGPGMGMGMGMGMGGMGMMGGPGMMGGQGMMGGGQPAGMPGGGATPMAGNASPGGGVPRGPAAMRGAGVPQQGPPPGSVGPTRFGTKGQHSYHPYGR